LNDYKELDVWKKSVALTTELYKLTTRFPDAERFGLTSQIRRATTSIAANIAEGWGRGSRREYTQFLTIARGSLMELETHLIVSNNLGFLKPSDLEIVTKPLQDIGKMLNRLIAVLRMPKGKTFASSPKSRVTSPESLVSSPELPSSRVPSPAHV
jgi:four helix bundle protein